MKILHVISGIQKAAGTSVFVGELASEQAAAGHDVAILVKYRCDNEYVVSNNVSIFSLNPQPSTPHSPDIVHIHALWDPWLTVQARHYRKLGAKIVWSPHGMLTPWALKNKWPKKVLGLLAYQYWSLRAADLIHVTADTEAADVRRLWLKNKIVLAPLGVHVRELRSEIEDQNCASPVDATSSSRQSKPQSKPHGGRYLCFVSRIQRKKGLPNLLRAWAQLPADLKRGWQIKIAGPDEDNHLAELYALCDELNLSYMPAPVDADVPTASPVDANFCSRPQQDQTVHSPTPTLHSNSNSPHPPEIEFLGPVYDVAKDALYANAAFSVLPTHSENFGSVVIESLAQGTPVICTKGAPWRDLVDYNCGLWIDIGVAPLVTALTQLLNTPTSQLRSMGARGRALVERKYTWPAVAKTIEDAYAKIL